MFGMPRKRICARLGLVVVISALGTGVASSQTCSTVSACVFGANSRGTPAGGFGAAAGVVGTSLSGDGIDGATSFHSTSTAAKSGVAGFDTSSGGTRNSGVFGSSGSGYGVHGTSNNGIGVLGVATSSKGTGIWAISKTLGFRADVPSGTGLLLNGSNDFTGTAGIVVNGATQDGIDIGSDYGVGLTISELYHGAGAYISSQSGDALDLVQGDNGVGSGVPLFIDDQSGFAQDLILATNAASKTVFALDPSGNLTIGGTLTQNGSPSSITKTSAGRAVTAYSSLSAEATIEDVGDASVRNGTATVALDPAFASTIDPSHPYYVFLTAEGENRGLYVTSRNRHGFSIRETSGGRSTLDVQYRVVAKPYAGVAQPRLAPVTTPDDAIVAQHLAKIREHLARTNAMFAALRAPARHAPLR